MALHGYRVTYAIRWSGPKSSYIYQRFFRAIYGYKQVVSKSNGRRYVYYREGVLTNYPYVKQGKTIVVVPDNALQPLLSFLKTGQNPAHRFNYTGQWSELVRYSIEETFVEPNVAADAVVAALQRIHVNLVGGAVSAIDLLERVSALSPEELYALYYAIRPVSSSNWFQAASAGAPEVYSRIQDLLSRI